MFKKVLIYTFMIVNLFTVNLLFCNDNTNDQINKTSLPLDGEISKLTTVWKLDFNYDEKEIAGEFKRNAPVKLPKNRYKIELDINDNLYNGSIYYLIPLFQMNQYEVDLNCNDIPLTGKIESEKKKKGIYKKYNFMLRYGKTKFEGNILYERRNDAKNFDFTIGDKKITGKISTESKGITSIKKINMHFDDKSLLGTIEKKAGTEKYSLKTDQLTDEDLFVFFFFMIFLEIDDYNLEIKDQN